MGYKMKGIKSFGEGTPLFQKHVKSEDLKEGDYMTYETKMYDKEGNPSKKIVEEDTSELKKDKTGRLYATDIYNPTDTIYPHPPK